MLGGDHRRLQPQFARRIGGNRSDRGNDAGRRQPERIPRTRDPKRLGEVANRRRGRKRDRVDLAVQDLPAQRLRLTRVHYCFIYGYDVHNRAPLAKLFRQYFTSLQRARNERPLAGHLRIRPVRQQALGNRLARHEVGLQPQQPAKGHGGRRTDRGDLSPGEGPPV